MTMSMPRLFFGFNLFSFVVFHGVPLPQSSVHRGHSHSQADGTKAYKEALEESSEGGRVSGIVHFLGAPEKTIAFQFWNSVM